MPRHKLTPDIWSAMLTAYTEWDPTNPSSPSIDNLCAGFDISKATFYYEMRKRNLPLKTHRTHTVASVHAATAALLDLLVESRAEYVRVRDENERLMVENSRLRDALRERPVE